MTADRTAERLLAKLEPQRHLAILLGLSTEDWRTTHQVCEAAPPSPIWRDWRDHSKGITGWSPQTYHSSVAHRLVALRAKNLVQQRKRAPEGSTVPVAQWSLSYLGQRVLDAARAADCLPPVPDDWTPTTDSRS